MRYAYKRWVRVVKVVVREGWGRAEWWLRLKFERLLALGGTKAWLSLHPPPSSSIPSALLLCQLFDFTSSHSPPTLFTLNHPNTSINQQCLARVAASPSPEERRLRTQASPSLARRRRGSSSPSVVSTVS
ncbi:hypothetical protein VTO73DRAFT_10711 [Trametes versicolor]